MGCCVNTRAVAGNKHTVSKRPAGLETLHSDEDNDNFEHPVL